MPTHTGALAALIAIAACSEPAPQFPANAPPEILQACALTERKCTACHERERFVEARHSPEQWRDIVDRMRRFPASSISPADAETILRCLNYHSSGTSHRARDHDADVVASLPMYVPPCGEVQPLHFGLHNRLHFTALERARRSVSPR